MGGVLSDLGCTLSAAGETEKAQAAFGRALYMCSRAYRRDAQTISMIRHNMAVSRLVHNFELDSASDSIVQSISGLTPTHIDGQSAAPQKDPKTRGQALLIQVVLLTRGGARVILILCTGAFGGTTRRSGRSFSRCCSCCAVAQEQ